MSKSSTIAERRTSILVAIIGVAGVIAPVLVNFLFALTTSLPIVNIDVRSPDGNTNSKALSATILLTNIGFGPATSVKLIVDAPLTILKVADTQSTAEVDDIITVDDKQFNRTEEPPKGGYGERLEAKIPTLMQGGGSFVQLDMTVDASKPFPPGRSPAYMIYDQGSTVRWFFWNSTDPGTIINNNILNVAEPYWSILFFPSLLLPIGYILYLYFSRVRFPGQRSVISNVINNITDIRRELKKDSKSRRGFCKPWKAKDSGIQFVKKKEMQDFIILDDFYAELDKRNQSLSSSDSELEVLNAHLLYLANNALEKIDWTKYPR